MIKTQMRKQPVDMIQNQIPTSSLISYSLPTNIYASLFGEYYITPDDNLCLLFENLSFYSPFISLPCIILGCNMQSVD